MPSVAMFLRSLFAVITLLATLSTADCNFSPYNFLNTQLSRDSIFTCPEDPAWGNTTERWSTIGQPTFAAAVTPADEHDLLYIVQAAKRFRFPFLATRSHHGYSSSLDAINNGLNVDLSRFDKVTVNATANTMTIGGGVLFSEILDPLFDAGKEIPTGACPCVSVLGPALAGGLARYQGLYGLIGDNILSVRIVTGRGDVVTASSTENTDLFWAVKGAGLNFGVVSEATFKIHDNHARNIVNADYIFSGDKVEDFYQAMKDLSTKMPPELSLLSIVYFDRELNGTAFLLNAVYAGSMEPAMSILSDFNNLGPVRTNISLVPWSVMPYVAGFSAWQPLCSKNRTRSLWSAALQSINVTNMVDIYHQYTKLYSEVSDAQASTYELAVYAPQGVQKTPDEETAVAYRDVTIHTLPYFEYTNRSLDSFINTFGGRIRDQIAEYSGFGVDFHHYRPHFPKRERHLRLYSNYAHGDEPLESLWGTRKLRRLRKLKRKWDPANVFGYFNGF
ncbi:FAD-dependent oxidase [Aulographum hederae CBS 113979]|uniref:FAD-dependent oxidase n=1 Tax=Aulographum hederae CBS 113979 TaxID=1176131 RepID=A0A6G1GJP5_9PEZI|nr:FAD-dependent oxidase [Aulographum hederae CBS 113979]